MQNETLAYINDVLTRLDIPYEFEEFTGNVNELDEYWVGEYQETEPINEDGMMETLFLLTGNANSKGVEGNLVLENTKQKIKEAFPPISGRVAILPNGSGVAIFYANSIKVPTVDGYKKLQINLKIKEWMVN